MRATQGPAPVSTAIAAGCILPATYTTDPAESMPNAKACCFKACRACLPIVRKGSLHHAYSLAGPKCTLDVNCSRTMEPNLKTFDPVVHKTILFDEAKASTVVERKALFQGRNAWVDMATSGTNCYSYKVWAYGTMMVVASNKWQQELDAMPAVDSAWL